MQVLEIGHVGTAARLLDRFAPFHLLHEELGRHGGVGFDAHIHALQFQQIARARQRFAQRAVGLVHLGRPLHGHAFFRIRAMRMAIGVHLRLALQIGLLEAVDIDTETTRQAKQRKVVLVQIAAGAAHLTHTLKLSPQPHSSFTFGLLNLNPSFSPSRTKSSSVPSR